MFTDESSAAVTNNSTARPRQASLASSSSLKTPRAARFVEATTIHSPLEPTSSDLPLRVLSTNSYAPQPQPADIGFGYMPEKHVAVEMEETDSHYGYGPISPPLKSTMRMPGAPPKSARSAMFNQVTAFRDEEEALEKEEALTEKEQANDLKIKTRVRVAKLLLRGVNFSCSLIVLSMLATTFTIFNATKSLPARNSLPPWAAGTNPWAQIVLLVISCISLALSVIILGSYWRGGHKRAEKVAIYYTVFAVAFFFFSIIMWGIGAGVLNGAKKSGNDKDLWGWACVDNTRRTLFQQEVSYELICRLQNWSLVCAIIEIVVETITIAIYGIVFYRFYSKRKLRKSMAKRDTARSDLYLAQLRSQSAPNTPGMQGPYSARDGGWKAPVDYYASAPDAEEASMGFEDVRYIDASRMPAQPKPFVLQPPPVKSATPRMQQTGFAPADIVTDSSITPPLRSPNVHHEQQQEHMTAAPGERVYENVPIPGAYTGALRSPSAMSR